MLKNVIKQYFLQFLPGQAGLKQVQVHVSAAQVMAVKDLNLSPELAKTIQQLENATIPVLQV